MQSKSYQLRHGIQYINSSLLYLPMFLFILLFFCHSIRVIGVVIEIIKVYSRRLSSSKTSFVIVMHNAKTLSHSKGIRGKSHNSIPVINNKVCLVYSVKVFIVILLRIKLLLSSMNKVVNTNSFYNLLS